MSRDGTGTARVVADEHEFDLSGGRLCVDFANTVSDRACEPRELLTGYSALVSWARQTGAVDADEATELLAEAARAPEVAARALRKAVRLREVLFRVFSAVARDGAPAQRDLAAFNALLARGLSRARVVTAGEGLQWGWRDSGISLDRPLWPVLRDAAELLTSEDLSRVGMCAADSCLWLFVDTSRNRSRRWCDMTTCGNRAKARRHYRKSTGAA